MVQVTGYVGYTGQTFDQWMLANNSYFSGVYSDITGFDMRLLDDESELMSKVSLVPTFNNFISLQTTFRNQQAARLVAVENRLAVLESSLTALRINFYEHRLE